MLLRLLIFMRALSRKVCKDAGRCKVSRAEHPLRARPLICSKELPSVSSVRPVQLMKQLAGRVLTPSPMTALWRVETDAMKFIPIRVTELGTTMCSMDVPTKHSLPMVVTPSGISMDVMFSHRVNALLPMNLQPDGMVIEAILEPAKAFALIDSIVSGRLTAERLASAPEAP